MKRAASIIFLIVLVILAIAFYPRGGGENEQGLITAAQAADFYAQENRLVVEKGTTLVGDEEISDETRVGINDTILVMEDSAATLYWFDDSISRLDAGTELTITMADYNPENISETHVEFEVIRGNVWSKVMNLVDEDSSFTSKSGEVAAGVRGTTYNFRVEGEEVTVEAIEHAAFVTQSDNGELLGTATVIPGDQAVLPKEAFQKKFEAKIENQPSWKLASEWFSMNSEQDVKDAAAIKARNMARLEARVGKLADVESALQTAEGKELVELEVAAAKLRIGALILSLDREGTDGKDLELIAREIQRVEALVRESDLSKREKQALLADMTAELKLVDRIIADVLPDNEGFYYAKDQLRKMTHAHLEGEDQEKFNQRMAYARLFELHDSLLKGWTLACYQDDLIAEFKLRAAENAQFKNALRSFVNDVKGMCDKQIQVDDIRDLEVRTGWEIRRAVNEPTSEVKIEAEVSNEPMMIQIDPPTLVIPARPAQ